MRWGTGMYHSGRRSSSESGTPNGTASAGISGSGSAVRASHSSSRSDTSGTAREYRAHRARAVRLSEPSGLATVQHPFVKMGNVDSTGDTHSELTGTAAVAERISAALQPFAELAGRPTAEFRALGTNEEVGAGDLRDASVFQAVNTVELLGNLDPAEFDAAALVQWADGIEQVRRMAEAAAVAVAEHVDRTAPFREQGLFSARTWLRHRLQLSGAEALARVRTARMHRQLPGWAEAEQVGGVGVAQSELMARCPPTPGSTVTSSSAMPMHC